MNERLRAIAAAFVERIEWWLAELGRLTSGRISRVAYDTEWQLCRASTYLREPFTYQEDEKVAALREYFATLQRVEMRPAPAPIDAHEITTDRAGLTDFVRGNDQQGDIRRDRRHGQS